MAKKPGGPSYIEKFETGWAIFRKGEQTGFSHTSLEVCAEHMKLDATQVASLKKTGKCEIPDK